MTPNSHVLGITFAFLMCVSFSLCLILCNIRDCGQPGSFVHGNFPGKNTLEGCHFIFQGILLTLQGLNLHLLCLLLWQVIMTWATREEANTLQSLDHIADSGLVQFSSVTQLCLTLWPHGLQHTRPPCPSPTPRVYSNSCPLSQWCHQSSYPPLSPCPHAFNLSQHQSIFQWDSSLHQVAEVFEFQLQSNTLLTELLWLAIEFQLQHQSFQWIFRTDFLYDGLGGSPCSRRDSQESYPTPQFKSIDSSALSCFYSPTLTSIHDYWKNHSFD